MDKKLIARIIGLLGYLIQGVAFFGIPVYVFFLGGSLWWMLAFVPLGIAGMIPLNLMKSMLKSEVNDDN